MKKSFKFYVAVWVMFLAIYNLAVFLVQPAPGWYKNYDLRFWLSWGVVITAYIGHLLCAKAVFEAKNIDKIFLNIPLVTQSYTSLIVMTIASSVLMLIPDCPAWIAAIVCTAITCFSVVALIKAKVAADLVSEIDAKIKADTVLVKMLTADAASLVSRAQNGTAKSAAKKVYEAIRYSDPMSNDKLAGIESEIVMKFNQFSDAVIANREEVTVLAEELMVLVSDRNNRCRLLK